MARRAQGGGRKKNSEPRVQRFNQWNGMNIQDSPRTFNSTGSVEEQQTDLQMTYNVIQNNVRLTEGKTLETRSQIVRLCSAPTGRFTPNVVCFGNRLYAAMSNGAIRYGNIGSSLSGSVSIDVNEGSSPQWNDIDIILGQLVAMSTDNRIFTGDLDSNKISNVPSLLKPSAIDSGNANPVVTHGTISMSEENDGDHPFRVGVCFTYLTKFGPSLPSDPYYFYVNKPTTEWNWEDYITITGHTHAQFREYIVGIEIYYVEGNYQDWAFLTHVDWKSYLEEDGEAPWSWGYSWYGTSDISNTTLWSISNLTVPEENYTAGVPATKACAIDGRVYYYGSTEFPYRLWIGGNPGNEFSVSQGTGGGFVDINPGENEVIRVVDKYKTQSGNSIVTMLCSADNTSREKRYNLVENAVTLSNEQSVKGWQAEEVSGAVGTRSYYGGIVCEDGLYSINRYGLALTTMTMEYNSQIKVNYISQAIEPVFHNLMSSSMENSILLNIDGRIYMAFGSGNGRIDNVIFVYDVGLKGWYTYTLDVDEPILNLIHIDSDQYQEGIGIVTANAIYLMPTTMETPKTTIPSQSFEIETGELSTVMPSQGMQHLTQLEFRFDHFIGDMVIEMVAVDQFGRKITTKKNISYNTVQYGLVEYMRIDLKVLSYKLRFSGRANFRMTHFMAKTYTLPNLVGIVWGFDTSQGHRTETDIHRYFKSYNDLKEAIIP